MKHRWSPSEAKMKMWPDTSNDSKPGIQSGKLWEEQLHHLVLKLHARVGKLIGTDLTNLGRDNPGEEVCLDDCHAIERSRSSSTPDTTPTHHGCIPRSQQSSKEVAAQHRVQNFHERHRSKCLCSRQHYDGNCHCDPRIPETLMQATCTRGYFSMYKNTNNCS